MTSLIVGIVLIVGGIAFAAAPFFRRSGDDASPEGLEPPDAARDAESPSIRPQAPAAQQAVHGALAAELEELELDRAMGKLSDADYRALRAALDARARATLPPDSAAGERPAAPAPSVPPSAPSPRPDAPDAPDGLASVPELPTPADAIPNAIRTPDDVDAEVERRVRSARALRVVCARCGPRPEPNARFCSNCGAGTGGCPACGHAQLPRGARFCDRCGTALRH
jgi:hypothetical protein